MSAYSREAQETKLSRKIGVTDTDILDDFLDVASDIIMQYRFPYDEWPDELENRYWGLEIRIATALYNKVGAEGETAHSENGVSRTYGAEDVPADLLAEITPKARVI